MFYVNIRGVPDSDLEFLGYSLVAEKDGFKMYRDYHGEEYVVDQSNPIIFVEDVNDAQLLAQRAGHKRLIKPPPR